MKDIKLNSDILLDKEFSVVNRGYNPKEVDSFLDEIINDYDAILEIEEYYKVQNKALQKTNSILRNKVEELEMQLELTKNSGYQVVNDASNIELIKKIAKLEGELYQTKLLLQEAKQ